MWTTSVQKEERISIILTHYIQKRESTISHLQMLKIDSKKM